MSVCVSVCPLACLKTTRPSFTKFSVHVTRDRGMVLRRRQCNKLCTSGFVDDVMFAYNGQEPKSRFERFWIVFNHDSGITGTCGRQSSGGSSRSESGAALRPNLDRSTVNTRASVRSGTAPCLDGGLFGTATRSSYGEQPTRVE